MNCVTLGCASSRRLPDARGEGGDDREWLACSRRLRVTVSPDVFAEITFDGSVQATIGLWSMAVITSPPSWNAKPEIVAVVISPRMPALAAGAGDPDHPPLGVDQRPAGVAMVDGGVMGRTLCSRRELSTQSVVRMTGVVGGRVSCEEPPR
jgi:hypothetical protein